MTEKMTEEEKKKFRNFIYSVLATGILVSGIAGLIVNFYSKNFPVNDILVSFFVATINVIVGAFVLITVVRKPHKYFFPYVMISLLIRMFVILGVFALCIAVLKFSPVYFTITFFALYFSYLILELFFIIKFKETPNI